MNRLLLTLLAAALAAVLETRLHAFSLEENIVLDNQGGCRVALVMTMPEKCQGLYRAAMRVISEDGGEGLLDEAAVRTYFRQWPGFTVESYHVFHLRQQIMVQVILHAKDARAAFAGGAIGELELRPSSKVIGDTELSIVLPKPEREIPAVLRKRANALAAAVDGMVFRVRLTTPTELLETTGNRDDFNRCSWVLTLDEMLDRNYRDIHARW